MHDSPPSSLFGAQSKGPRNHYDRMPKESSNTTSSLLGAQALGMGYQYDKLNNRKEVPAKKLSEKWVEIINNSKTDQKENKANKEEDIHIKYPNTIWGTKESHNKEENQAESLTFHNSQLVIEAGQTPGTSLYKLHMHDYLSDLSELEEEDENSDTEIEIDSKSEAHLSEAECELQLKLSEENSKEEENQAEKKTENEKAEQDNEEQSSHTPGKKDNDKKNTENLHSSDNESISSNTGTKPRSQKTMNNEKRNTRSSQKKN